jgi:hypothetical protein
MIKINKMKNDFLARFLVIFLWVGAASGLAGVNSQVDAYPASQFPIFKPKQTNEEIINNSIVRLHHKFLTKLTNFEVDPNQATVFQKETYLSVAGQREVRLFVPEQFKTNGSLYLKMPDGEFSQRAFRECKSTDVGECPEAWYWGYEDESKVESSDWFQEKISNIYFKLDINPTSDKRLPMTYKFIIGGHGDRTYPSPLTQTYKVEVEFGIMISQ